MDAVSILWEKVPATITNKDLFHELNLLSLKTLYKSRNYEGLKESLGKLELPVFHTRWKIFLNAVVSRETGGDTATTGNLYEEAIKKFPANEEVWASSIDFFKANGQVQKAYNQCAEYLRVYGNTKFMLFRYVDLCLEQYLLDFSDTAVAELKDFMGEEEHKEYLSSYIARKQEIFAEEE